MTQELKKVIERRSPIRFSRDHSQLACCLQHRTPAVYAQEDQSAPDDEESARCSRPAAIREAEKVIKTSKIYQAILDEAMTAY